MHQLTLSIRPLKNCLGEDGLDINKIVGIGTDGASSMVGRTHSLTTFLRTDNPELIIYRYVLSLASSCRLPTVVDFMVKETHSWFSNCPKRINAYQSI